MTMAQLYKANGEIVDYPPADGKKHTLEEMQAAVGGWIEGVPMPDGRQMYVNEDGIALCLPYNNAATALVAEWLMPGDYIKGDALVLTMEEDEESEE